MTYPTLWLASTWWDTRWFRYVRDGKGPRGPLVRWCLVRMRPKLALYTVRKLLNILPLPFDWLAKNIRCRAPVHVSRNKHTTPVDMHWGVKEQDHRSQPKRSYVLINEPCQFIISSGIYNKMKYQHSESDHHPTIGPRSCQLWQCHISCIEDSNKFQSYSIRVTQGLLV